MFFTGRDQADLLPVLKHLQVDSLLLFLFMLFCFLAAFALLLNKNYICFHLVYAGRRVREEGSDREHSDPAQGASQQRQ